VGEDYTPKSDKIIELNEKVIRDHLGEMVRSTVEDTLNRMLDAEADSFCNAEKYQRTEARTDTRAGHGNKSWTVYLNWKRRSKTQRDTARKSERLLTLP